MAFSASPAHSTGISSAAPLPCLLLSSATSTKKRPNYLLNAAEYVFSSPAVYETTNVISGGNQMENENGLKKP
jgi:hypothetical protein